MSHIEWRPQSEGLRRVYQGSELLRGESVGRLHTCPYAHTMGRRSLRGYRFGQLHRGRSCECDQRALAGAVSHRAGAANIPATDATNTILLFAAFKEPFAGKFLPSEPPPNRVGPHDFIQVADSQDTQRREQAIPAQCARPLKGPTSSASPASHCGISSSLVRSKGAIRCGVPSNSRAVSFSLSTFRPTSTTRAPNPPSKVAVLRPIPAEAPVTTIVRPVRSRGLIISRRAGCPQR